MAVSANVLPVEQAKALGHRYDGRAYVELLAIGAIPDWLPGRSIEII